MAAREYSDWKGRMADILSQLGIYEKDKPKPPRGYGSTWSPDNPYGDIINKSKWEDAQTTTYEERQAEARKAIAGDLEQFHSDFQGEHGYHWDDVQALRDLDKAWKFEGDAVSGYNLAWEDLKGTASGDALQGLLDEGYHKPYDQSFDEYDKSIDWGYGTEGNKGRDVKLNKHVSNFKKNQPPNVSVREHGYYTSGETSKLGLDLQRIGDHTAWDDDKDNEELYNKNLYRDLYTNAIDWSSYNQNESMWKQAANMARDDIDLKSLSNEERVGIYGIDWSGEFDREDEIRQVNQWMAERGWEHGDESTWNTELLSDWYKPKPIDLSKYQDDLNNLANTFESTRDIQAADIQQLKDFYASLSGDFMTGLQSLKSDYISDLEEAQAGWDAEKATLTEQMEADAAGWESRVKAWDQQSADWESEFAQQRLKYETDLAAQLSKQEGQYLQEMAIRGEQSQAEIDKWQKQAADEREQFAKQLEAYGLASSDQIDQLKATFAQQQEDSRLQEIEERSHLESQLSDFYTTQWNQQQDALTSKYEDLLSKATTEAEAARLEQARDYEQKQLDQQAAWKKEAQEIANRDRVYDDRLSELKAELGIQEGLYAGLDADFRSSLDTYDQYNKAEREAIEQQLGTLGVTLEDQLSLAGQRNESERQALEEKLGISFKDQLGTLGTSFEEQLASAGQYGEAERQALAEQLASVGQYSAAERDALAEQLTSVGQYSQTEREALAKKLAEEKQFGAEEREALSKQLTESGQLSQEERDAIAKQLSEATKYSQAERDALEKQLASEGQYNKAERDALSTKLGTINTSLAQQIADASKLGAEERGALSGELRGEFGEGLAAQKEDWTKGITGAKQEFTKGITGAKQEFTEGIDKTRREYQEGFDVQKALIDEGARQRQSLSNAIKRNEEMAIQNAERSRVSASYGSQGTPLNKEVQGVRTLNELKPSRAYGGASGSFNRKGLRIKNLNI
jgi:hypothetical protein